jgi:DNA-binding SARP family transcriptional activator
MEFRILGPLDVREGGRALAIGGPKQRALLAVLLLHANEAVSSERLIDQLWGDEPPESATKALHFYVSHLRKVLEPDRPLGSPGGSDAPMFVKRRGVARSGRRLAAVVV